MTEGSRATRSPGRPEAFDVIVVGAGPAGATAAHALAGSGLSTLVLDRAEFPRDKPCGGGVTARAAALLSFALDPVVAEVVAEVELGLAYGQRFVRRAERPLVLMTERSQLDAFLVACAVDAGVVFRDGTRVEAVELRPDGATVRTARWSATAGAVIGADGANGTTARELGIGGDREHLVALEAEAPHGAIDAGAFRGRLLLELGIIPGGYAWVFPKEDHANLGVVGWRSEGPRLREHLHRLAGHLDVDPARFERVRGYRLPLRSPGDPLVRGRSILVGDAAGVVDPLTGEGIYEAFLSARLGAEAVAAFLHGRAPDLRGYPRALEAALGPATAASWSIKASFDRFPRLSHALLRTPSAWRAISTIFRDPDAHDVVHRPLPAALAHLGARAERRRREAARPAAATTW